MSSREPNIPLRSPTFDHRGFQPLRNEHENDREMGYDSSIQMQAMPRRSGSSTGARRKGEGTNIPQDFSTASTFKDEEKKGFFRSGGRRKDPNAPKPTTRVDTDGEEVSVNAIGRFYNKIINFSIVTRYFVYVLPIGGALAVPIVYYALTDRNDYITDAIGVRTWLFFLWIEIVWLSLWVSKLMAKFVPWLFMTLIGVVSSGTKKYALILKAVEIELSLVGWSMTSLVTFTALTSETINDRIANSKPGVNGIVADPHWIVIMQRILVPIFISTMLLLGEKMVIQLISINYHRRSFDQRIKESKHTIHLLGLLYDASRTLFPTYCPEFAEEDYVINDTIEAILAKSKIKMHRRRGSRTPLKVLGDIGRVGDKVTSMFGNIAHEITGKQVFNPTSAHSVVVEALEKPRSSEALARRLWMSFVVEGKDSLHPEDLEEVLGPSRQEEAEEAFNALDGDGNGDISLEEMILKVVEVGRTRKSIAASMHDVGQAIGVLDNILLWILLIIVVFIFIAFQNTNFLTTLATAGTTLLSLSFVFAATTQEFLGSCIFLFVKHPFDVGDRVDIEGANGKHLVVEQISLLYTLFKRIDNMKIVQIPNIVLNNLWVENVTRSKAMKEPLEMSISFDTSLEDIELLRLEMEKFVRHPDNARDYQPDLTLEASGIGSMDKLLLKIEICHKSNWHNETIRAARRSKFMCALVLALRKVPIYGPGGGGEPLGGPTNPGYSVAVGDSWAANARDKAQAAKDAKRLAAAGGDIEAHEADAADAMNARNPVSDAAHPSDDSKGYPGSREDAVRRRRDSDIEQLRDGLKKSKSNRGVRRAGDHIPDEPQRVPDVSVTGPAAFQGYQTSPYGTREILDEEAELGIRQTSTGPLGASSTENFASPFGSPQPPTGAGGYSVYPQQSYQQQQQQQQYTQYPSQLQPLGSSPPRQRAPSPPQGGRLRKLSLSVRPSGNGGSSS